MEDGGDINWLSEMDVFFNRYLLELGNPPNPGLIQADNRESSNWPSEISGTHRMTSFCRDWWRRSRNGTREPCSR